jgi:xanthine dehydrogenase small subunit
MGAALTLSEIEALWRDAPEAVRQWFPLFASLPIRNRATLGGNLATASPIGDAAPLLLALGASVEIASPQGRRLVPLSGFFQGYRQTALEAGEILSAVEVPLPLPAFVRFYKVSKRRMDDITTVAAGFSMSCDAAGNVQSAVFALGGVAAVPMRVFAAEEAVLGQKWDLAAVRRVQAAFERVLQPMSDHRGSAEYRRAVAKSLVEKFWWESRKQEGDAAA